MGATKRFSEVGDDLDRSVAWWRGLFRPLELLRKRGGREDDQGRKEDEGAKHDGHTVALRPSQCKRLKPADVERAIRLRRLSPGDLDGGNS
jgi:hypothetical protein